MKLKRLDVIGFKSFLEKTSIDFPSGISAIVGPNGCGKSNIVDALRWVMGEQSIKQLRGKAMEDVIFSGTDGKSPLNMAEVSLTLLNNNGTAPEELKDFTEIMVTRRLYRSGESTYLINKQPCRLKDIHNLFMGSGMGVKTYAVIQQGNIGAITDAGPEERRLFIEEAAGITRYKNRKTEALRKVESTNQNLLRVSDIITEVKRQMAGLKRQAKKAERYKAYQDRIRSLDVRLSFVYHDDYTQAINDVDALLKDLKDTDIGHTSKLKKLDAAVEDIKVQRWKKNQEISEQKSQKFETQRTLDRIENDLSHLRKDIERLAGEAEALESARADIEAKNRNIISEISQIEQQITSLTQEIETVNTALDQKRLTSQQISNQSASLNQTLEKSKTDLMDLVAREARYKNIYQNASNNKESLNRRLKRTAEEEATAAKSVTEARNRETRVSQQLDLLKKKKDDLNHRIAIVQEQLNEKSTVLGKQIKHVQTLELERNNARTSLSTLKKMENNYEWYRDGVKAIMQRGKINEDPNTPDNISSALKEDGIMGLMADILEPETSFETAVEAVLGESLQYIIVKDQQTAQASINYLQTTGAGRSGFIPLPCVKAMQVISPKKPNPANLLLNHVVVKPGFEDIIKALLDHVVIADNLEAALNVYNHNGVFQTVVTKDGDIVSHQGILIGGSKENLAGILVKKQEIKSLEHQITTLDQKLSSGRLDQNELESTVRHIENNLQKLIEQKHKTTQTETETEKTLYKATEDFKHARRHLDIVRLEQEQLLGETSDIDDEMTRHNKIIVEIEKEVKWAQDKVAGTSEKISVVSSELEKINQKIVDLQLKRTSLKARLENGNTTLRRLREFEDDGINRLEQLSREINEKYQKRTASKQKITDHDQRLAQLYDNIKHLEQTLENNEADYQAIDARLKENDGIISELQSKREATLQKIRLLELEQSQQNIKRENLVSRLEEYYHKSLFELRTEFSQQADETPETQKLSMDEMEEELTHYRNKIANIDDVNLGAIKEYEQLETRFNFLTEQRDDLVRAVEDLHKVIRKINRITQARFIKTFDLVNEKLSGVFPRLFNGGTARLMLTQPDKPLETGVEFMIHPPGKKLTRMSLLSGGEKALSAIAFIFSIFLIKPASFCLMDEIDAPLDEANIYRFNDLLKIIGEQSQIIMVTHNKKSMEFADTLLGITMEKKGISKVVSVNLAQSEG